MARTFFTAAASQEKALEAFTSAFGMLDVYEDRYKAEHDVAVARDGGYKHDVYELTVEARKV